MKSNIHYCKQIVICIKNIFLTWESIKANFRILPDHFRGVTKRCFFFKISFFAPVIPTWNSRRFAWRAP